MSVSEGGNHRLYAGVDVGSISAEALLLDQEGAIAAAAAVVTGARSRAAGAEVLAEALGQAGAGPENLAALVATGYGRDCVAGRTDTRTEIACHARGIAYHYPDVRLLLDVGGQDAKAIAVCGGTVLDFAMNDRCAAGTGRFFEVMARALEVDLDDLGPLALESRRELTVSSLCTVFAESEVIGLLAREEQPADIAAALCRAAAQRVVALADRVGRGVPVALSGGTARNVGFAAAVERALGVEVLVPERPEFVGALGAALWGLDAQSVATTGDEDSAVLRDQGRA
jgi:predicted CoA-substrate-specific enzyme activase